jgi:hypothetical protein
MLPIVQNRTRANRRATNSYFLFSLTQLRWWAGYREARASWITTFAIQAFLAILHTIWRWWATYMSSRSVSTLGRYALISRRERVMRQVQMVNG